MAISLNNTSSGRTSDTDTLTFSHTVDTGSNKLLLVGTSVQDSNHANYPITDIKYGGVALTKLQSNEAGGNNRTELWYLKDPAEGTANVVVTATGTLGELAAISLSLNGVNQSTSFEGWAGADGNSSTPSRVIGQDVNPDGCWFFTVCSAEAVFTGNGADQNTIATLTDQSFENARATYEGPKIPAAADTQSFTLANGASWALSTVVVSPAITPSASLSPSASSSASLSPSASSSVPQVWFIKPLKRWNGTTWEEIDVSG